MSLTVGKKDYHVMFTSTNKTDIDSITVIMKCNTWAYSLLFKEIFKKSKNDSYFEAH